MSPLDWRGGYLRQARLAGADLSNCNLEGVCLSGADLTVLNSITPRNVPLESMI